MRYIVVNGRTPAPNAFCALCTEKIGETYCREIDTRLLYCCESHYTGHVNVTVLALEYSIRAWSRSLGPLRIFRELSPVAAGGQMCRARDPWTYITGWWTRNSAAE
jgi:hypothetical protein